MATSMTLSVDVPGSVRQQEARRARRRLYPVSVLYTAYTLVLLAVALQGPRPGLAAVWFFAGCCAWTAVEYLVHRFVLHGRFPDGPGLVRRLLHQHFDHLHWEHHRRPWDGNHVNGTTRDTLPFVLVLAGLASLAPLETAPLFVAGVVASYVAEEWIHHAVHFCNFKVRYFQYIRRHHMYHHSQRGVEMAYGLTNGFWDVVWGTRIPEPERRLLYPGRARAAAERRPPPSPSTSEPRLGRT